MPDMSKYKNHPGFIAYSKSNVPTSNAETQEQDAEKANQEVKSDQQYSGNNGGELGKAE